MVRPRIETDVVATFRRARVLTLDELGGRLSVSRSTVLRRLEEIGYFTSYNHRGEFLTIEDVADFDSRGLWVFQTARFSRRGTLKDTVRHFVDDSPAGMTHEELCGLLGVRVHNTLTELARRRAVRRERLGPTFVYFSAAAKVRRGQVRARSSALEAAGPRPTNRQIVATLLELIRDPQVLRPEIVARCQCAGVTITRQVVDTIFSKYDLDKKRAL